MYLVGVRLESAFPKCLFDQLLVRVRGHQLVLGYLEDLAVLVELVVLEQGGRHFGGFLGEGRGMDGTTACFALAVCENAARDPSRDGPAGQSVSPSSFLHHFSRSFCPSRDRVSLSPISLRRRRSLRAD